MSTQQKMKRQQAVYFTDELHKKLILYCSQKNKTRTAVVTDALEDFLSKYLYIDIDVFEKHYNEGIFK